MTKEHRKEYMRVYGKQYYIKHKKEIDCRANRQRLKTTYGITMEQYNAMAQDQKECCAICGRHRSNFTNKLYIDHNHLDGKIRGLLCHFCNTGLGNFQENIAYLQTAISYLEGRK